MKTDTEDKFLRDNGKVRFCDSNIAKTNIFTYHFYFNKWYAFFFPVQFPKEIFIDILRLVLFILQIIPYGCIIGLFNSRAKIKKAREAVERNKRRRDDKR